MTRDEAIAKASENYIIGERVPESFVRLATALGILKLDEPKSVKERFLAVVVEEIKVPSTVMADPKNNTRAVGIILFEALQTAGLKIVEK